MTKSNLKTYYDVIGGFDKSSPKDIPFLVNVEGKIRELCEPYDEGKKYVPLYFNDPSVQNAYANTAIYIALKAAFDAIEKKLDCRFKFRIRNGYYFEYENIICTDELIKKIKSGFDRLVSEKAIIETKVYTREDAFKLFDEKGLDDVKLLFKYTVSPFIKLRSLESYIRYIKGCLLYHAGYILTYDIIKYHKGFVLILPDSSDVTQLNSFNPGEKYFEVQNDTIDWVRKLGIDTVGKLNNHIAKGEIDDIVIMNESYQDKIIGDIASKIYESKKKLVFIAGPSSSGKTSFSHRLMYHLKALNLKPYPIASDNFFIDREKTPIDKNGNHNLECLEAMDTELLEKTLKNLIDCVETELPVFDFLQGKQLFNGDKVKLDQDNIIILEGIHCLNPALTPTIDRTRIFSVYVSALAEICLDNVNRIPTSDLRLLRRMERDRKSRGHSIKETILRWKSVREGEEKNIFPYQENADVYFNSSLCYELPVLKTNVMPLLYEVYDDKEVGSVVTRLIKLLNFCLSTYTETIPKYSLVREFIGGSILNGGKL